MLSDETLKSLDAILSEAADLTQSRSQWERIKRVREELAALPDSEAPKTGMWMGLDLANGPDQTVEVLYGGACGGGKSWLSGVKLRATRLIPPCSMQSVRR